MSQNLHSFAKRMAGDSSSKAFGKVAKKKQNLEMYDALESTINRVTDQAQKFRRKMDELVSKIFFISENSIFKLSLGDLVWGCPKRLPQKTYQKTENYPKSFGLICQQQALNHLSCW